MVRVSVPEAQTRSRYRKTTGWLGWGVRHLVWYAVTVQVVGAVRSEGHPVNSANQLQTGGTSLRFNPKFF